MKFLGYRKQLSFFALFSITMLIVLAFAFSTYAAKPKGIATSTPKDQILYTQFSLFYEENRYLTTNYRKGILVPVNTEVSFVSANKNTIEVKLPDGQKLVIENIKDYSGEEIDGIFTRTFAVQPIDLSQFTEDEKNAIMSGEVKIGMR